MTRQILPATLLLLSVSLAAMTASASGRADSNDGLGLDAFARRAAGTYLLQFGCGDQPAEPPEMLVTLGADGTYVSEDTADLGDNPVLSRAGGLRGSWVRTGRAAVAIAAIDFEFDASGVQIGYLRWDPVAVFDTAFTQISLGGPAGLYTASQDPLNPNETPFLALDCGGTGRKVLVRQ